MFDGLKLFDSYGLRAQIFPALIAGLPTLGLLIVLVPWDHLGFPHAIAAFMTGVLMYAFADLARRYGRKVEAELGTRTSPQLFYRANTTIEEPLKIRYRAFLAKKIGIQAPTLEEETNNPVQSNQFYNAASTWLREHTRDHKKFSLVFNELVNYGFRRNLLGLKYFSLAMNLLVLAVGGAILVAGWHRVDVIPDAETKLWTVIGVAIAHSLYMGIGVNKTAVIESSLAYGRQLILSCEAFIEMKQPVADRKAKRKKSATASAPIP